MRRPLLALAATTLVSASAAGTVLAQNADTLPGPFERNDTAKKAKGSLKSGVRYRARIETLSDFTNTLKDDQDWFVLRAKKATRLKINVKMIGKKGAFCFAPVLSVRNKKRKIVKSVHPLVGTSKTLKVKVKRGRNYVVVAPYTVQRCGTPEKYSFKIRRTRAVKRIGKKRFLKP